MIGNTALSAEFWQHGRSDSCPIIDMHGHMGAWSSIYFPRPDADAMIGTMDECGVRLLVFSHHMALFSPELGNRTSAEAVRQHPDRLRAYTVINGHYMESVRADLDAFDRERDVFTGLKFLSDYHQIALTDARYESVWAFANERQLPVLCHTWGGSPYDGEAQVRTIAERYPQVRLLMGHSCHGAWNAAADIARNHPNVYLELTAVFDDRGVIELFVEQAGSEKLLFGTDLPWFDPHHAVGVLLSADITDEDRRNICYRNAVRVLEGHVELAVP